MIKRLNVFPIVRNSQGILEMFKNCRGHFFLCTITCHCSSLEANMLFHNSVISFASQNSKDAARGVRVRPPGAYVSHAQRAPCTLMNTAPSTSCIASVSCFRWFGKMPEARRCSVHWVIPTHTSSPASTRQQRGRSWRRNPGA